MGVISRQVVYEYRYESWFSVTPVTRIMCRSPKLPGLVVVVSN